MVISFFLGTVVEQFVFFARWCCWHIGVHDHVCQLPLDQRANVFTGVVVVCQFLKNGKVISKALSYQSVLVEFFVVTIEVHTVLAVLMDECHKMAAQEAFRK